MFYRTFSRCPWRHQSGRGQRLKRILALPESFPRTISYFDELNLIARCRRPLRTSTDELCPHREGCRRTPPWHLREATVQRTFSPRVLPVEGRDSGADCGHSHRDSDSARHPAGGDGKTKSQAEAEPKAAKSTTVPRLRLPSLFFNAEKNRRT